MIRGLYTAAAGMMSVLLAQDSTANNLANVNAPGFKKSVVSFKNFPDTLMRRLNTDFNQNTGKDLAPEMGIMANGSQISSVNVDFTQGGIQPTGKALDFAISGDGFFAIQDGNQTIYTRSGNFMVNGKHQLTTIEGKPVLNTKNQPVDLSNLNIEKLIVDDKGNIFNGKDLITTLKVVQFDDNNMLERAGSTGFIAQNVQSHEAQNFSIVHKALESANTNPIETVIASIEGMRTYESLAKIIKTEDNTLGLAVRNVGKV